MDKKLIAAYTKLPQSVLKRYESFTPQQIFDDADYVAALEKLDRALLEETLPHAREAYDGHLQEFSKRLQRKYRFNTRPMSPFTLGNWVVGFLQFPGQASKLVELHGKLSGEMIIDSLPELLEMLDAMPRGSEEWKRALCLLALPLMRMN